MSKGAKDKTVRPRQSTESAAGASLAAEATREAARMQKDATLGAAEITRGGVITVAKLSLLGVFVTSSLGCLGVVGGQVVATYLKNPQSVTETLSRHGPAPAVVTIIVLESGGRAGRLDSPEMADVAGRIAAEILRANCGPAGTSAEPAGCGLDSGRRPTVILEFRAR